MKMESTATCQTDLSVANSPQTPQLFPTRQRPQTIPFLSLTYPSSGIKGRAPNQGAAKNYDAFYQFFE